MIAMRHLLPSRVGMKLTVDRRGTPGFSLSGEGKEVVVSMV
jgi:hypothetical protein